MQKIITSINNWVSECFNKLGRSFDWFRGTPEEPLFKQPYFWMISGAPILLVIAWIAFGGLEHSFCFFEKSCYLTLAGLLPTEWKWLLGLSVVFAGLIASNHRSVMTAHQIQSDAYTTHRDSFIKYLEKNIDREKMKSKIVRERFNPYYTFSSVFNRPATTIDKEFESNVHKLFWSLSTKSHKVERFLKYSSNGAVYSFEQEKKVQEYFSALNELTVRLYLKLAGSALSGQQEKLEDLSSLFEDLVNIQNNIYWFLGRYQDDLPAMYQKILELNRNFIEHGFSDLSEQGIAEALQKKSKDDGKRVREKIEVSMSTEQKEQHKLLEESYQTYLNKKD